MLGSIPAGGTMITRDKRKLNQFYNLRYSGYDCYSDDYPDLDGIGFEEDQIVVCALLYEKRRNNTYEIHLAIDKPVREWIIECINLLFNDLQLQEVYGIVDNDNYKVIKLAESIGAKIIQINEYQTQYILKRNTGIHKYIEEKIMARNAILGVVRRAGVVRAGKELPIGTVVLKNSTYILPTGGQYSLTTGALLQEQAPFDPNANFVKNAPEYK